MTGKTLSRAIVYSLGAHGLAFATIFMVNVNAALPHQPLETLPFIRASLIYAMAGKSDEMTVARLQQKMKPETSTASRALETDPSVEPFAHSLKEKSEPAVVMTASESTRQVENPESSTALHLPDLRKSGGSASQGRPSVNRYAVKTQQASFGGTIKLTALPRYLSTSRPAYPMIARMRGYEGVVMISVEVLPDGRTGQVRINRSSGYASLDRSALEAVKEWRFEPAIKSGQAVTMWVEIPVRFSLNDDA